MQVCLKRSTLDMSYSQPHFGIGVAREYTPLRIGCPLGYALPAPRRIDESRRTAIRIAVDILADNQRASVTVLGNMAAGEGQRTHRHTQFEENRTQRNT